MRGVVGSAGTATAVRHASRWRLNGVGGRASGARRGVRSWGVLMLAESVVTLILLITDTVDESKFSAGVEPVASSVSEAKRS